MVATIDAYTNTLIRPALRREPRVDDVKSKISTLLAAAALAVLLGGWPLHAAEPLAVSVSDLQATARSLGFLDTLRRDGTIVIGIVYASPSDRAQAAQAADRLRAIPGPNASEIRPELIAAADFSQVPGRLDAVFLMPGVWAAHAGVAETVRRRRVVSISNDPTCLDARCCVLLIRTTRGVEIFLDTALADAVGARFSSVFSMMVKRK
jgi:hypothetical protein